jgi:hypothetical protein
MTQRIAVIGLALAIAFAPVSASAQSRARGKTPTFLEMFPREQMDCGKRGWAFPSLIGGNTPLTACILKYRNNAGRSPFGPL